MISNIKDASYVKIITDTDLERKLLVLSPTKLESLCEYKGKKLWILDGKNDYYKPYSLYNDTDKNSLRFGGLTKWYNARPEIKSGTKIKITFNPEEEPHQGLHVVHIEYI